MVQRLGVAELGPEQQISIARKHLVNALYETPGERFIKVREVLKKEEGFGANLSDWDLLCFCAIFLTTMAPAFNWLGDVRLKELCQDIHFAHYYDPDTNCGIGGRRVIEGSNSATENTINPTRQQDSGGSETGEHTVSDKGNSEP